MSQKLKEQQVSLSIEETTQNKVSPLKIIVSSIGLLLMACSFYLMLSQFSTTIKANLKIGLPMIFLWVFLISLSKWFLKKNQKIILIGFLILFFILFLLSFYWTKDAGIQIFNEFLAYLGRFNGAYYFGLEVGNQLNFTLFFLVLTQFLVLLSLTVAQFFYSGSLIVWLSYLIIGGFWLKSFNVYSLVCLLLATLILLIFKKMNLNNQSVKLNVRLLALTLGFIILMITPIYLLKVDQMILTSGQVANLHEEIKDKKEVYNYGKDEFLPMGQLKNYQEKRTDKQVLEVEMSSIEPLYLKQFIGKEVAGNNWESLSKDSLYEDYSLNYWLNQAKFSSFSQLSDISLAVKNKQSKTNEIRVQNSNGSTKEQFIPYGMIKSKNWENEITNDAFIPGNKKKEETSYTYDIVSNVLTNYPILVKDFSVMKKDKASNDYLLNESNYNEFVYKNYLSVPDEIIGKLTTVSGVNPHLKEHVYYEKADKIIIDYVKKNYQKPTKKDKTPKDFIDLALSNDYHLKFDTEIATLSTLLYRHMGIPARYVEGYVVTPESILKSKDNQVNITGKEAHAWTEIYQDGIGWVPKETMATYLNIMPQPEFEGLSYSGDKDNNEDAKGNATAKGRQELQDNEKSDTKQVEDKQKKEFKKTFIIILVSLLVLALIVGLGFILLKTLKAYNRRKQAKLAMEDTDSLIAAKAKLNEVFRLLEADQVSLPGGSLYDYVPLIDAQYKDAKYTQLYEKVIRDIQKSAYSNNSTLTDKEIGRMDKLLASTTYHVFENKSFKQKVKMKQILYYS